MTLDELIEALQDIRAHHGTDLPLRIRAPDLSHQDADISGWNHYDVLDVQTRDAGDHEIVFLYTGNHAASET